MKSEIREELQIKQYSDKCVSNNNNNKAKARPSWHMPVKIECKETQKWKKLYILVQNVAHTDLDDLSV
jgi:hypothetical protein